MGPSAPSRIRDDLGGGFDLSAGVRYRAFPGLGPKDLFGSGSNPNDGGLTSRCGPGTILGFHQARGALWHAMRALAIGPGDRVLVPAYHCGVEVEAILDAGASVDYYPVTYALRSDPVEIRRRGAPTTRAVLWIHYFGFPRPVDPILAICREKGWVLIEDCAHLPCHYHAGGAVGLVGDMALYSLPKTLPVPDGGLLRVNRGPAPAEPPLPPRSLPVGRQVVRLAISGFESSRNPVVRAAGGGLEAAVRLAAATARRSSVSSDLSEWNPAGGGFRPEMARYRLSAFSRRVLDRTDLDRVAERRRENYEHLSRRLDGRGSTAACFPELPLDACPMVFPVRSANRSGLESDLARRGVGTFVFGKNLHPTMSRTEFPEAGALSDSVLGLPVQQDLDARAIDAIADAYLAATEGTAAPSIAPVEP